jgi:GPH family glycoside/pentoside/hexuronide:cation symporter
LVGLATALGLAWDAVIDPWIGHLSDRASLRGGSRHRFMILGAVGMGPAFFAIFCPPPGLTTSALFAWLLVTSLLVRTTSSFFSVPYLALGAELSEDYHERVSVAAARAAFALLGTLVAAVLSFLAFFPDGAGADAKLERSGYATMGLVFGLAMSAAPLVASLGTWSHPGPAATRSGPREDATAGFGAGLLLAVRSRAFLVLALSTSIFFLASVVNASLALHYLTLHARVTASLSISLYQLAFYVGALAGVGIWLRVTRRVEKHVVCSGALVVTALLMVGAWALVGEGRPLGVGNLTPLLLGHGLAGCFASALWVIPPAMVADVADEDELRSGRRREGTFFGIKSFALQAAAGLAILLAVLVDSVWPRAGPGPRSAETVRHALVRPPPAAHCSSRPAPCWPTAGSGVRESASLSGRPTPRSMETTPGAGGPPLVSASSTLFLRRARSPMVMKSSED